MYGKFWAWNGLLYHDFGAHGYTIVVLGPFGVDDNLNHLRGVHRQQTSAKGSVQIIKKGGFHNQGPVDPKD